MVLFLILFFIGSVSVCASPGASVDQEHSVEYPKIEYGQGVQASLVKRGEYLTKAGDCIACHSVEGGAPFSGGLPLETVFGTFYSPNITPDEEFGIGSWSDKDFINAMRHGIGFKGEQLFPAFPYVYYNRMSDDDVLSIKAYLDKIPKVAKKNKEHEIMFPFSVRALQWVWKLFFFFPDSGQYEYDLDRSDTWNRGRYLVEGPAHCGMCHTPHNFVGVAKNRLAFTGNTVDGWLAPNITGTNLIKVQEKELVKMFVTDEKPGGRGFVQGPMRQVNHDSLIYLSEDDLYAIAYYIKSTVQLQPDDKPSVISGDDLTVGKQVYKSYCASCHDVGSSGSPKLGDADEWLKRMQEGKDTLYHSAIYGKGAMSAKGLCPDDQACSDEQVKLAVDYILSKSLPQDLSKVSSVKKGKKPKVYTMEDGRDIFMQHCASCHINGENNAPKLGNKNDWKDIINLSFDVIVAGVLQDEYIFSNEDEDNKVKCYVPKGGCLDCNDAQIIAATKYLLQSVLPGDMNYEDW